MLQGIDISNNNGAIDWAAVTGDSRGIRFAAAKATEGVGFKDATFPANFAGMYSNGLLRAAYHFARPDLSAPEDEAAFFLSYAEREMVAGDVPILDLERGLKAAIMVKMHILRSPSAPDPIAFREFRVTKAHIPQIVGSTAASMSEWALRWLRAVAKELGCNPWLYCSRYFLQEFGIADPAFADFGLYIADWGVVRPTVPAPWPFYACWQYGDAGTVSGINGSVDLDVFNGTEAQFIAYGLPQPTPAPQPEPPAPTKPQMTDKDRLQLVGYVAGGSGPTDITNWVAQFSD